MKGGIDNKYNRKQESIEMRKQALNITSTIQLYLETRSLFDNNHEFELNHLKVQ